MLPDAQTALGNPCLNFNTDYPWAFTLASESLLIHSRSSESMPSLHIPAYIGDRCQGFWGDLTTEFTFVCVLGNTPCFAWPAMAKGHHILPHLFPELDSVRRQLMRCTMQVLPSYSLSAGRWHSPASCAPGCTCRHSPTVMMLRSLCSMTSKRHTPICRSHLLPICQV